MHKTLVIIKPDAVRDGNIGKIIQRFEKGGFNIVAIKMVKLKRKTARKFYSVHKNKPFYNDLVEFMISGKCVPMLIEGDDIIDSVRNFIGTTNPGDAVKDSIRRLFGNSITKNAVHASDSPETARFEIPFFFKK